MTRNDIARLASTVLVLAILTSCNAGSGNLIPAGQSTQGAQTSLATESPESRTPVITAAIETPTEIPPTPAVRILADDEFALPIEFHAWDDISGDQVLLMLSSEDRLKEAGEVSLDYLTWDGQRGPLATFELEPNSAIEGELMTGGGNAALILYFTLPFSAHEYYVLDFTRQEIVGFKDDCDVPSGLTVGPEYVAFTCSETHLLWRFFSYYDPTQQMTFVLRAKDVPDIRFRPIWLDNNRLLFAQDYRKAACSADLFSWDPVCKAFDFWLGPMSPDGKWFEVRTGSEISPDQVGYLGSGCLFQSTLPCSPRFQFLPSSVAPQSSAKRFLADSTWTPDSSALLYIVQVNSDMKTMNAEQSEIWQYAINDRSFGMLFDLPGELHFGDPRFELAPAPWSPDGKSVVVKEGGTLSLLNIETGELTYLTEGGVLLGTITLP